MYHCVYCRPCLQLKYKSNFTVLPINTFTTPKDTPSGAPATGGGVRGRRKRNSSPRWRRLGGWRSSEPRPGPDRMFFSFVFSFCCSILVDWREGEGEEPLGRHGSPWVAAGDTGREWDSEKKNHVKTTAPCPWAAAELLPWPFGPHIEG